MQQELEQIFLSDWRRFSPGYLKVHKSKKDLRPSEGDLVLVKGDKLNDLGRYGMVEKLVSPKTLLIRLRAGAQLERTVGQTILLAPQGILKS